MRFTVTGKNMNVTEALHDAAVSKIGKLEKYFTKDVSAHITMIVERKRHIIEVTIPVKGSVIRAEEEADNMYTAIDLVIDVLERQLLKYRKKLIDKHRGNDVFKSEFVEGKDVFLSETVEPEVHEHDEIKIVRSKRFGIKPMDSVEACMEMELLGHDFFVFRNRETDEVNVVYKRKGGAYGLIEPEY